jgi:hypothetical protein
VVLKDFKNVESLDRVLQLYRNYRASAFKRHGEYAMIRCVDFDSFSAQLSNLDSVETEITISVLEN